MRKNAVRNVIVHEPEKPMRHTFAEQIGILYADAIARRLKRADLTKKQKLAVIDEILRRRKNGRDETVR